MTNEVKVSLDFESSVHTLKELEDFLYITADNSSHSGGDPRSKKSVWEESLLRKRSIISGNSNVSLHIAYIQENFQDSIERASGNEDIRAVLNIAKFTNRAHATVSIHPESLRYFCNQNVRIDITIYST